MADCRETQIKYRQPEVLWQAIQLLPDINNTLRINSCCMTQPEVLSLANNAVNAIQPVQQIESVSTLQLLRSLGDPQVRKGMARLLNIVKTLANDPQDQNVN